MPSWPGFAICIFWRIRRASKSFFPSKLRDVATERFKFIEYSRFHLLNHVRGNPLLDGIPDQLACAAESLRFGESPPLRSDRAVTEFHLNCERPLFTFLRQAFHHYSNRSLAALRLRSLLIIKNKQGTATANHTTAK